MEGGEKRNKEDRSWGFFRHVFICLTAPQTITEMDGEMLAIRLDA
jgi:hypothetical protein